MLDYLLKMKTLTNLDYNRVNTLLKILTWLLLAVSRLANNANLSGRTNTVTNKIQSTLRLSIVTMEHNHRVIKTIIIDNQMLIQG